MASISLNPEESAAPDALSSKVSLEFLEKLFGTKKKQVKDVLLDQDLIRGIGNAYADDILWHAGVSPFSKADKIPSDKIEKIVRSMKKVLADATEKIAASHPGIIAGEVRDHMLVHDPKKEKSPDSEEIKSLKGTKKRSKRS